MSIVASQGLLKHSLLGFSSSYMITYFRGKTLICWCCTIIGYWEFCFQSLLTVPVVDNYDILHWCIFFIVHTAPLYCSLGTFHLSPVIACLSFITDWFCSSVKCVLPMIFTLHLYLMYIFHILLSESQCYHFVIDLFELILSLTGV